MKKFITFILLLASLALLPNLTKAETFYEFNVSDTIEREHDGSNSRTLTGEINMNGLITNQIIHFLDFELGNNIHLVAVDNYPAFGYNTLTLEGMIIRYQLDNPGIEVLAGINGDFYDINNTNRPSSVHINNYEVLRGNQNGSNILNFREDGSVDIGKAEVDGYEILVKDINQEIKIRQKIDFINNSDLGPNQSGVYFSSFDGQLPINAVLIDASDIKYEGSNLQFAKGTPNLETEIDDISEQAFVIGGSIITDRLTSDDTVTVQVKLKGYENVRGAVGGTSILMVDNGVPTNSENMDKHPRTAVGIREDGSVFFMVAQGRNIPTAYGVTYEEIGHLMVEQGAKYAINLDGGGSSTLMARELDGTFTVINTPTDGRLRSVSNGVLLVRGDIDPRPIEILGEDTRAPFQVPTNIYVNSYNEVRFDEVLGATRYIVEVGGIEYQTSSTKLSLNHLLPRKYEVRVKVMGTEINSASSFSTSFIHEVKRVPVQDMINYLREYAKNIN